MIVRRVVGGVILLAALTPVTAVYGDPMSPTIAVHDNAAVDTGADEDPAIAMDSSGRVVVVWTSTDTLGGTIGADADILVVRSEGYGAAWSPVAPLVASAAGDSADDRRVTITTDDAGVFVVAWQTRGSFGADADVVFVRSTDGGLSWSAPALLDTAGAGDTDDDEQPRLATDRVGRWIAVWTSREGDADVVYAVSIDNGATWSPATPLEASAALDVDDDLEPVVTAGENGWWAVAWASNAARTGPTTADYDLLIVRSNNDGMSWSAPALLIANGNTDAGDDRAPVLATDGTGRWLAVWHQNGSLPWGPDGDILTARSANEGASWSQPRELYSFSLIELGEERDPRVVSDRAGNWIVVWWREDSLPGGVAQDVDILQARSVDGGATWIGPELINSDAFTDTGNDYSPAIATTRTGNWRVVWHSDDSLGGTIGTDHDIVTAGAVCGDGFVRLNEQCDDGNLVAGDCCTPSCQLVPALTVCRAAGGGCDVAEVCTGVDGLCPADVFVGAGTQCRGSTGACDPADVCSGLDGVCPLDVPAPLGTSCRAAASACDAPEVCDGANLTCPADIVAPAGATCRAAADVCDTAEACDGLSGVCPEDGFAPQGTACRPLAGDCDVAEVCTGAQAGCPDDVRVALGVVCRPAASVCDAAELCVGLAACPADAPMVDGAPCADGEVCDGTEICVSGACVPGAGLSCDDGNLCTAESCVEPGGCGVTPVVGCCNTNADCADGDACTADVCSGPGGTCSSALIPGCCNNATDCDDLDVCTVNVCSGPGGSCSASAVSNCCTVDADCAPQACAAVSCDLGTNRCVATPTPNCCTVDADCADADACTTNTCDTAGGVCLTSTSTTVECCSTAGDCDDGDVCTADSCAAPGAVCGHAPIDGCCVADADCSDGNSCTTDRCDLDTNRCAADPIVDCCAVDADCEAGPVCTTVSCVAGQCMREPTRGCCTLDSQCDDGDGCTFDRCEASSCTHAPSCAPDAGVDGGEGPADGADAGPDVVTPDVDAGPDVEVVPDVDAGPDVEVVPDVEDAGPTPDGADAGVDGVDGGAPVVDAGTGDGFELDDDGCECSSTHTPRDTATPWSAGLLAVLLILVRRRRPRAG